MPRPRPVPLQLLVECDERGLSVAQLRQLLLHWIDARPNDAVPEHLHQLEEVLVA